MQGVPLRGILHRLCENRIALETSVLDGAIDPGEILIDDPARADVEVTDLRVALLAGGQSDRLPCGGKRRVRPARPERVPVWLVGGGDRVAGRFRPITPAIDDDQDERALAYTRDWATSALA